MTGHPEEGEGATTRLIGEALCEGRLDLSELRLLLAQDALDPEAIQSLTREAPQDPAEALTFGGLGSSASGQELTRPRSSTPPPEGTRQIAAWGRYRDLQLIGEGGMGRIYRARDPQLKRTVALKLLRNDDPTQSERFIREAQLQASVDHPGICPVFEAGEWQGRAYIVMPFLEGRNLKLMATRLSLEEKVRLMAEVAEAVHAAHRRGLIHRDLKPANLMVIRGEEGGWKPVILDFGIARGLDAPGLTVTGFVVGTPHYMSPEQARGEGDRVDRRTDIYALGVTLYELACGITPFGEAQGLDCIRQALQEDPPPLRKREPSTPVDLETIVHTCLEKEPALRYPSARALAEDLRRYLDGDPIQARPIPLGLRLLRKARRNRPLLAVASAALLLALGFGGWTLRNGRIARERAHWAESFGQEAERIEALVRYLRTMPLHDLRPDLHRLRQRMDGFEAQARRAGSVAQGPAAYALGRAHLAMGDLTAAKPMLEQAWSSGLRSPAVSQAYGVLLGRLYQDGLGQALRLPDPGLRSRRIEELKQMYWIPSLWHLRRGEGSRLEPRSYQEALLAYFENRPAEAADLAQEAAREAPWLYEALRLEGEACLALVRDQTEGPDPTPRLDRALAAFQAAQRVGRSDASLFLGEAQVWRARMETAWKAGQNPERLAEACGRLCETALAAGAEPALPRALQAWAWAEMGRYRSERGLDPVPALQRAISEADSALRAAPGHPDGLGVLVFAHSQLGLYRWTRSLDPRPAFSAALQRAQEALGRDPKDLYASVYAAKALIWRMGYEMENGLDPGPSFETCKAMLDSAVALRPGVAYLKGLLGFVLGEWADHLRTHGLDPSESTQRSAQAFRAALGLDAGTADLHFGLGNAHLIQGEYQLDRGEDPRNSLREAESAYRETLRLNPTKSRFPSNLAETLLKRARHELWEGRSPIPDLEVARTHLQRAATLNPRDPGVRAREGEAALLQARWELSRGLDPSRTLDAAEIALQQLLNLRQKPDDFALLAEAKRLRAEADPTQALQGLEAADRAIRLNPACFKAWLQRGELEVLRTARGLVRPAAGITAAREAHDRVHHLNPNQKRPLEDLDRRIRALEARYGQSTK